MTPAQASGHPNFVVDVPIQGPTDEGLRAADCWWAQNRLPKHPACVDCGGPIPMWTKHSLCPGNRLTNSGIGGLGEQLSFGRAPVRGFALGAAEDSEIWTKLTAEQQAWVMEALLEFNDEVVATTGTTCPTFGPSITAAGGCFQAWYNHNYLPINPQAVRLRTDGVFDLNTLKALITTVGMAGGEIPFPGALPEEPKKKLSTGAMVGIAAAGVAVVGGVAWAVTRKPRRRR